MVLKLIASRDLRVLLASSIPNTRLGDILRLELDVSWAQRRFALSTDYKAKLPAETPETQRKEATEINLSLVQFRLYTSLKGRKDKSFQLQGNSTTPLPPPV